MPSYDGLFGDATTADFTFVVDGEEFPAHTAILKQDTSGPYFASTIAGPFRESTDRRSEIGDIRKDVFKGILEYIYKGRMSFSFQSYSDLVDIYRAADRFQVNSLAEYVKNELYLCIQHKNLNPTENIELIQAMRDLPALHEAMALCARRLVERNWDGAKQCEKWDEIAEDTAFLHVLLDAAAAKPGYLAPAPVVLDDEETDSESEDGSEGGSEGGDRAPPPASRALLNLADGYGNFDTFVAEM
ncbi:BTB/POZ domain-containing protein 9 [Borealophlyctis nickersoniae]|nr:BTB/POZ domain-containing protein 9 [Borealophlyctis nickersoniae]